MKAKTRCPSCGDQIEITIPSDPQACECGSHYLDVPAVPAPGITIRDVKLHEHLSTSSTGEIFLGEQRFTGRTVEVKIMRPRPDAEEEYARFRRDIDQSIQLQHPNILALYSAGEDSGYLYLIREHRKGQRLSRHLREEGQLSEIEAIGILRDIASAVAYAWTEFQIVHRNLKPKTILLSESGAAIRDMGISRAASSQLVTAKGFTVGTPAYMSPEQIRAQKNLSDRSDVYSLGCLAYEMLTGDPPFEDAAPLLVIHRQLDEIPPPVNEAATHVSVATTRLLANMLDKDYRCRPNAARVVQRADEILKRLRTPITKTIKKAHLPSPVELGDAPVPPPPEAK